MHSRRTFLAAAVASAALSGCPGSGSGDSSTSTPSDETRSPESTGPDGTTDRPQPATSTGRPEGTGSSPARGSAPDLSVSWTSGPDTFLRRTQTTAVALDGRVYVVGGIVDAEERHTAVYDPAEKRWTKAAPPPKPVNHTAAAAYGGRIHVFGGYSGSFLGSDPLAAHWVYDPAADEWTDAPPLPTPRGALVAVATGDRIYAVGGAAKDGTTGTVEVYDPDAASWSTGPALPTPREHLAGGAVGGRVYAAGGRQGLGPMVDATACYGGDGSWESRAPIPTARAGIAGAALAGHLFVFGGEEVGQQVFEEVEAYHPPTDAWQAVAPLPTPRWGLGVAALDGRVYTVGGGAVPSAEETRTLEIMTVDG